MSIRATSKPVGWLKGLILRQWIRTYVADYPGMGEQEAAACSTAWEKIRRAGTSTEGCMLVLFAREFCLAVKLLRMGGGIQYDPSIFDGTHQYVSALAIQAAIEYHESLGNRAVLKIRERS